MRDLTATEIADVGGARTPLLGIRTNKDDSPLPVRHPAGPGATGGSPGHASGAVSVPSGWTAWLSMFRRQLDHSNRNVSR